MKSLCNMKFYMQSEDKVNGGCGKDFHTHAGFSPKTSYAREGQVFQRSPRDSCPAKDAGSVAENILILFSYWLQASSH